MFLPLPLIDGGGIEHAVLNFLFFFFFLLIMKLLVRTDSAAAVTNQMGSILKVLRKLAN